MINVIDVVVAVLVAIQLLKSLGSPLRIIRGILVIILSLIIFGIAARLLLDAPLPKAVHDALEESYFVKISHAMIKWVYPAIEKSAPTVDTFIKKKIISAPAPEVKLPKVTLPEKVLPKLTLPEIPELK